MRVMLEVLGQLRRDRLARGIVDAFGNGDHAAAMAFIHRAHIGQKALKLEDPLGEINQVRAVIGELFPQR